MNSNLSQRIILQRGLVWHALVWHALAEVRSASKGSNSSSSSSDVGTLAVWRKDLCAVVHPNAKLLWPKCRREGCSHGTLPHVGRWRIRASIPVPPLGAQDR